MSPPFRWRHPYVIGSSLVGLALLVRLAWVLLVPTIVVGDFATYRESAAFLSEYGRFDDGFIYMPGLVVLLAGVSRLGGEVLAGKMLGVAFGGIATGAIYSLTLAMGRGLKIATAANLQNKRATAEEQAEGETDVEALAPRAAFAAGLGFALWPAGIATASVIGTDVPCAAMLCAALACLSTWGEKRPRLAALSFGAAMGFAAYFRAVAFPLSVLSAGYWLAYRTPLRSVVLRTALAVAMTLVVLSPWAIRNAKDSGHVSFTDTHGGITALMGNDPNTEGTYSRALSVRFKQLTGRTFLSKPHEETDRVAFARAKRWIAFEPAWTAGMVALRIERLLAAEHGLLYWSIYRPGILPPEDTNAFNNHRPFVTGLTNAFAWWLVLGICAGLAFVLRTRHLPLLLSLAFSLALLATYALFVAEPRYRLTSEILAFPLAGWGWVRLVTTVRDARKLLSSRARQWELGGVALLFLGTALAMNLMIAGGQILRARHRWAVSVSRVDGVAQETFWRSQTHVDGRERRLDSVVWGGTDSVRILPPLTEKQPTERQSAAPQKTESHSRVDLEMPDVSMSSTNASSLHFRARLLWTSAWQSASSAVPVYASVDVSAPFDSTSPPFARASSNDNVVEGVIPRSNNSSSDPLRLRIDVSWPSDVTPPAALALSNLEFTTSP